MMQILFCSHPKSVTNRNLDFNLIWLVLCNGYLGSQLT